MSEEKNYSQLQYYATNGDNVDSELDNFGVENDANLSSTSESRVLFSKSNKGDLVNNKRAPKYIKAFDKDFVDGHKIDSLEEFLRKGENSSWEEIKRVVTAEALCKEKDPLDKAFEIHGKLRHIAEISTENTRAIEKLADRVEDFAYDLLDRVKSIEEKDIHDKAADRYASLFSEITTKAIAKGQQKFVSHPFIFRRVEKRWKLGLSKDFQSRLLHRLLLLLIMMLDAILTPVMLPVNAYVAYKDQQRHFGKKSESDVGSPGNKRKKRRIFAEFLVIYRDYRETPYVIFMKTQFMQLVFIGLFLRISMSGSSVAPTFEEYLILLFFLGFVLSEIQQYRSSASKVYFRDMWNFLDVMIILIYAFVVLSRIATIIIGGDAHNNRLLELANYGYGMDAMLLILRFSSILELSSVIGPLQLALFRMCLDLVVILVQFGFVIVAFSLAITKCYTAETSFLTPLNGSNIAEYCIEGNLNCFLKSARQLVWSVFGMIHFEEMESLTSLTSDIVVALYLVFLVLSVIMLVNILVALLTTTYDKYKTNSEIEWKFSRAVIEEQYRRMHVVVVPFNIFSEPLKALYFAKYSDLRDEIKDERKKKYEEFFQDFFFPKVTERYRIKYKGLFPKTVDRKLDTLGENIEAMKMKMEEKDLRMMDLEGKLEVVLEQLQRMLKGDPKENEGGSNKRVSSVVVDEEAKASLVNRKLSNSTVEVQIHAPRGEQAQKETENRTIGTPQMKNSTGDDV